MIFVIMLAVKQVAQVPGSLDEREADGYYSLAIGVERR